MKKLLFFLSFLPYCATANMESPYAFKGERESFNEAMTSADIDILDEKMKITILSAAYAKYEVVYHIRTDKDGRQIPLLFDTHDIYKNFKVDLDKKPVTLLKIPKGVVNFLEKTPNNQKFRVFKNYNYSNNYAYFEVNLSKGEHTITVVYTLQSIYRPAEEAILRDNFFFYNLEPARHWRSYGTLDIQIFAPASQELRTNLGVEYTDTEQDNYYAAANYNENSKPFKSGASWHFDKLPQNRFSIQFIPALNPRLKVAIFIKSISLILWFLGTILLIILHIIALKKHEKAVLWGGAIVAFTIVSVLPFSLYALIEKIGGAENIFIDRDYALIGFSTALFIPFYCFVLWEIKDFMRVKGWIEW
jgi:hypothetical protein